MKGQCLCGAVQFEVTGEPIWSLVCHCESCRKATSSPVTAFVCFPKTAVSWTGQPPASYHSSEKAERWFCGRCGSQLAYLSNIRTEQIDLYTATLESPETFPPTGSAFPEEAISFTAHIVNLPKAN